MSAQMVAKEPDWTPETVKIRGVLMLNVMLRLLGEKEDLLSENEKLHLLGLEFLIEKTISDEPNFV